MRYAMGLENGGSRGWDRHMVNMGNVWDRTTEFLSDNLGAIMPTALLAIFVPQSVSTAITQAGAAVNPVVGQIVGLLLILIIIWGQLAVTALALSPEAGRGAAQSLATRRFVHAIAAMLIPFALVVLLAIPIFVALVAGGVDLAAMMQPQGRVQADVPGGIRTFIGLYSLFWLIAAVFIAVRFTTLLCSVVLAEGGVVAALRRSFALSRGIMWKMIGVVLLFGLVYMVAYLAITSVFGFLFKLVAPDAGPFGIGAIVVAILAGAVATAYSVTVAAFAAKLYRAAVAAREGAPAA